MMAHKNMNLWVSALALTGMILSGNWSWAAPSANHGNLTADGPGPHQLSSQGTRPLAPSAMPFQVAQTVPGVNVMDQGKGTLGAGEKDSAYQTSEEGKKRFQKAKSITAKKVMITGKVDESAAKTIVPFSKFFTAGYVGEEMDAVGEVLGIKAPRSKGGLLTRDFMTTNDRIYIDIGMDDDVQAGDRFIVFSQHEEVRHPLKKFFITFDREVDLLDGNYEGQYYSDWFSFRHDIEGNQIRIKGVIRILETSTITSKALVEHAFAPINIEDVLVPFPKQSPPMISVDFVPPKKDIQGVILSNRGRNLMFTMNDVVYIDQGEEDGVEKGDRLQVYVYPLNVDEDEEDMNPEVIGEIVIISIQEDTSTGVILTAADPIFPGQKVRSKP